mgnify:CR=1 FL=1
MRSLPRPSRARAASLAAALALCLSACAAGPGSDPGSDPGPAGAASQAPGEPERLVAVEQERYPFDATSFTQGLEVAPDGDLYVSTGQWGESRVYRGPVGGEQVASQSIAPALFGEGITLVDDSLWQLTWQDHTAFKRDARTLEETDRATYDGEGWGICYRKGAGEVIFSDGSAQLRRMDPDTLAERERFTVTENGRPVAGLNELECVGDNVYANIFTTTDIVRIDARTGEVTARIDASGLANNAQPDPNNVLNGIAHVPGSGEAGEFYLTGKRWPDLYRVTFEPAG